MTRRELPGYKQKMALVYFFLCEVLHSLEFRVPSCELVPIFSHKFTLKLKAVIASAACFVKVIPAVGMLPEFYDSDYNQYLVTHFFS